MRLLWPQALLLFALGSVACLGGKERAATSSKLDAGTTGGGGNASRAPKVDTEFASRWWRTPDGSYHLVGPARPRGEELTLDPSDHGPDWKNQAFGYRGTLTVWWNIEHNCGLDPEPRVKVAANRILLSAAVTGQPRSNCPILVTCFRTFVSDLPPGTYEVSNPPYYKAHVEVSGDEVLKAPPYGNP